MTRLEKARLILEENRRKQEVGNNSTNISFQDRINQKIDSIKKNNIRTRNKIDKDSNVVTTRTISKILKIDKVPLSYFDDLKIDKEKNRLKHKKIHEKREQKEYIKKQLKLIKGEDFNSQRLEFIIEKLADSLLIDFKLIDIIVSFIQNIKKEPDYIEQFKLIIKELKVFIYKISIDDNRVLLN